MPDARHILSDSFLALRTHPAFYGALGGSAVLFVWTQDLVPIAGLLLSSLAIILLIARMFSIDRKPRLGPLLGLALLSFPLNMLWEVLFSLHKNTSWTDTLSSAWSVPVLFFMSLVLVSLARSIRIVVLESAGVDRALARGWRETTAHWRAILPACLVMTILLTLSLATMGWGFVLAAPFGMALLKISAEV